MQIPQIKTNIRSCEKRNYTFRVYKAQGIERYETSSIRRFLNHLRSINWSNDLKKVYLRVSYGKFLDHVGVLINFHNDGTYDNSTELRQVLRAFLEE